MLWHQKDSIIPVETPPFMRYCVCLDSVWQIVKGFKINFLWHGKPDVSLCFITVMHMVLNWEIPAGC